MSLDVLQQARDSGEPLQVVAAATGCNGSANSVSIADIDESGFALYLKGLEISRISLCGISPEIAEYLGRQGFQVEVVDPPSSQRSRSVCESASQVPCFVNTS